MKTLGGLFCSLVHGLFLAPLWLLAHWFLCLWLAQSQFLVLFESNLGDGLTGKRTHWTKRKSGRHVVILTPVVQI